MLPFDPDAHAAQAQATSYASPLAAVAAPALAPAEDERGLARPIDNDAKWRLVKLAKATLKVLIEAGEAEEGTCFDTWRQAEARKATGGPSISEASVRHYRLIQAHFLDLQKKHAAAALARQKAAVAALELARNALRTELLKSGQGWHAAQTLASRFYKGTHLRDLTAKQVWSVVFTLRNNANAAAGRGKAANRFKRKRAAAAAAKAGRGDQETLRL